MINVFPGIISHDDTIGLLCLTMLVYDYGKKFTINPNETLETFINNANVKDLSDSKTSALDLLCKRSPQGIARLFVNNDETDLQAGITISEEKEKIYVVFRGSESITDWLYDLRVSKKDLDNGVKVHSGFYNQLKNNHSYEKIIREIKNILSEKKYNHYQIYVTGHSLGAALATLFGYFLADEIINDITVVSFASPRVGNYKFREHFDKKQNLSHYRIVNNRDIVTVCPTWYYYHVGKCICLEDNDVILTKNYPKYERSIFNCWSVKEHSCDMYYSRLLENKWS